MLINGVPYTGWLSIVVPIGVLSHCQLPRDMLILFENQVTYS